MRKTMISRDTKVGKMLKEHPQALEVLLEASAHFRKLQNPILRKTLAPRVTIEQAAQIAGVNLSELLQRLNKKIGANMPIAEAPSVAPPAQRDAERPEILNKLQPVELDVRPILQGGTDPLKTILKTIEQLAPDQYLHLLNSFEPIPLYTVLGKRGFEHFTEFIDGTFHVHFYRHMPTPEKMPPPPMSADVPAREKIIELDVRALSPPEPMMKILEVIPQVDEKTLLFVHHHREPLFLYEKLQARGYKWHVKKIAENYFHVKIWKDGEIVISPNKEPQTLDVRQLPPAKRHSLIFQAFEALKPGEAFVLVNDHDPKPLYYQFKFEQEGRFTWECLEQGPEVWRVRIGKV
jgi:uncharacterized protein (DUF2249 family)